MSGGRGAGGGPGGYPGPGYGGAEYGDDGYGAGGTPSAGGDPQWDDSVWQRDQPDAWASPDADQTRGVPEAYDPQGYGPQGYDPQGYDPQGYDPQGYDPQGYDPQGYDPQGYDPQGYDPQGYDPQSYDPQGYDPQAYDPQGYSGPGYGGQDYDQPGYAGQPYEGQPYEGQPYEGQPYADQGVPGSGPAFQPVPSSGQHRYPRTGPQPAYPASGAQPAYPGSGAQPAYPGSGAQPAYPGSGAQPLQRSSGAQSAYPGSGPYPAPAGQRGPATGSRPVQPGTGGLPQAPAGYDQRGTGEQRMAAASGGAGGYEDSRWDQQQGDDSFLPGFGPRDDFEGGRGRGQDRPGNGGRGRGPGRGRAADRGQAPNPGGEYNGYDDPRAQRGTAADPRRRDPREPVGYPDGPGYPGGPARPDARRQQGLRPGGRGSDGRGPDPRTRDPRHGTRGDGTRGDGTRGDGNDPDDRKPRRRRRSPIRRLAPWIALLVIVIPLALVGWHIYGIWRAKTHPADYAGSGTAPTVTVHVPSGETADELAPTLLADGVVASTRAFVLAAENSSDPTGLEPGYFILNHHMQASLAWAALLNPKNRDQFMVTIPEGKRASQVIATLSQVTKIPLKDFQQVIDHPAQLGLPSYADGKVEGFLFPATYPIQPHETALQILQAMVARYNVEATQTINLTSAAAKVHLTPREVIIEASMAQAEGGSVSDYPKIARVIINRLKVNMPLQFDSVLLYGLNKYAINVTDAQIATPGPYNDFEHDGLPPGPISNPGNAAIEGILNPTPGNWLYFLTNTGGKSEFSATPLPGQ